MRLDAVPIGKNPPHDVNVVIEVPIGGEPVKYELDKASGALMVDRFLYTAMRYPGNYGFIPHTLSDDGDPCDVIVANTRAIFPGAVISVPHRRRAADGGRVRRRREAHRRALRLAHQALRRGFATSPTCPRSPASRSSTSSRTTRTLEPGKWVKIIRWGDADEARELC